MKDKKYERPEVLVSVLRRVKDRDILLKERWYRIPFTKAPRRKPAYIAFYQTANFGNSGKRIEFYGRVKFWRLKKRYEILPEEKDAPGYRRLYLQFFFKDVKKLRCPVKNRDRMRVSFGFTSLKKLFASKSLGSLYDIPPIEDILAKEMKKRKLEYFSQYYVKGRNRQRYFLDFALCGRKNRLDVECDGYKWHSLKKQREKDKNRDRALKALGWKILRITEEEIVNDPSRAGRKVKAALVKPVKGGRTVARHFKEPGKKT